MPPVPDDRSISALRRLLEAAGSTEEPRADPAVTILPYIPKGRRPEASRPAAAPGRPSLTLQAGFIPPCLPMTAPVPPDGRLWLYEIKRDGVRIIARHDGQRVRLYGRNGEDLTPHYPQIAETMARLPACTIDGEAITGEARDPGSLDLPGRRPRSVLLAFDLIELEGDDRRRDGLAYRKLDLTRVLARGGPAIVANEWFEGADHDGAAVFAQACALGHEGIVWKRKDSRYISGRSPYWLMMKNPAREAAVRAAAAERNTTKQ